MLALMQQQPPPSLPQDFYARPRTMSLAVLPSSPVTTYSQHDFPTTGSPSPSKRPKLSLDTSSVAPTAFGKKATSLRLETLSATSPTVRNTFSNAHEQKPSRLRLTPITTTFSDSPATATPAQTYPSTPIDDQQRPQSTASSISSNSSASTLDLTEIPYKLPFNHTSILKNGPIDRRSTQQQTTSFAQSKPMFPPPKKVGFKAPLTEEIVTTKFTMRHSDIEVEADSSISTLDLNEAKQTSVVEDEAEEGDAGQETDMTASSAASSPHTGDKRESSDEEEDEADDASYPTTPIAGRRKRHRMWRWTLGPVGSSETSEGDDTEQASTNVVAATHADGVKKDDEER